MSTHQLTVMAERDFAGEERFLGDMEAQTGIAAPQGDLTLVLSGQRVIDLPGGLENPAGRAASVEEALDARRVAVSG